MKNARRLIMDYELSYWLAMTERYFLAETTEEEEARLRKFLCSSEGQDPRFDEVRATMAYLQVCREASPVPSKGGGKHPLYIAVAACLVIAMFLGWYQYQQYNISSVRVAGEDIETDASMVMQKQMAEMFNSLDH